MNSDILWQAFVDTGDPSYYVLYKGGEGHMPAATD